jgi:hypothetical protein
MKEDMRTELMKDSVSLDDPSSYDAGVYVTKYSDLLSQAFADKDEESIRNLIDRIYQEGFEDGTNEDDKGKIWYVLQAYDCVGETAVNLFKNEKDAKAFFDKQVEKNKQWAKEDGHEQDLTNDDYCTITDDYAYFSGEILGGNMDTMIILSWEKVPSDDQCEA